MAALHSGTLSGLPPVDECRGDPFKNSLFGVDNPATVGGPGGIKRYILKFEMYGDDIELYRHPMLFMHSDAMAWYESYSALSTGFFEKERYIEQSPLWMDCYHIYTKYLDKFKEALK